MLQDLYAEAAHCVKELRHHGMVEDADALEAGLYGATSGEALALIGAAIKAALSSDRPIPGAVRERLVRLLRDVDAALRRAR